MQNRKLLVTAIALVAFSVMGTFVALGNPSGSASAGPYDTPTPCPTHQLPVGGQCATITPTYTPTPCPTHKVPDTFGGSGCGTPTYTPTSQGPALTPTATPCPIHTVPDPNGDGCIKVTQTVTPTPIPCPTDMAPGPFGGCIPAITPTVTPCPTHQFPVEGQCATITPTPTSVRPANFTFQFTVNGQDEPVTVGLRAPVTFEWRIVNLANWPLNVVVDNDSLDDLDHKCERLSSGGTCSVSLTTGFNTAGTYTSTTRADGNPAPPCAGCPGLVLLDTVTVHVVTTLGDFNCDGMMNAIDAALVLQLTAALIQPFSCTGAGDVNDDGYTNAIDAALILQATACLLIEPWWPGCG